MDLELISEECSELGIVKGIPSIEGGIFKQEVGIDRKAVIGEIAVLSGFDQEDVDKIRIGADILGELVASDPPKEGHYLFDPGVTVCVIPDTRANQTISDNAAKSYAGLGSSHVTEYRPYDAKN